MKKIFFIALVATATLLPAFTVKTASAAVTYATAGPMAPNDAPTWIYAPAINLFSPIQGVGTNTKGEMDVPSGYTNNVGWYAGGVAPGNTGTAVLDAHVFAAFKNLNKLPLGSDIYIYMKSGRVLHYVTKASNLYSLATLSPYTLFAPTSAKQLNLITCAGKFTTRLSTYDHRLIVTAELV
ncbi:class F sortase [Candidatus Parcubacteria bacterium]|nr:class F sortase [Candidatus Parcubacteria bacterium]